ncbi:TRAP transporter large permease [Halotalea alkalilenta]|uniref:TRAP transporter large permease protein n=1 Tax=Halotalea alkalilenta TaxID=376489 RepID=A0A172YGQ4_9GAMM|nr:TRAP transporter large permease [Halotalea alkalilenta]ANF58296.1 TRAP dicarboxylate transporter subunit DctM [Halotalea alkalilenta]
MLVILAVSFTILLLIGVPVGFALLSGSMLTILFGGSVNPLIIPQRIFSGMDSFSLLAIPFFLFTGALISQGGLADRLVRFANAVVGRFRGGLAMSNVLSSVLFGGISGSAVADTSALGRTFIPAMVRSGYTPAFSVAVTAASAPLSPMIPPSIAWILYGFITDTSIIRLFMAAIIPSLLWAAAMLAVVIWKAHREEMPVLPPAPLKEVVVTARAASLALLLPVFILFGIRMGIFTVTEAAAIAVLYAMGVGLIYRSMNLSTFLESVRSTVQSTAVVMIIIGAAGLFAWILAHTRTPEAIATWILSVADTPLAFLMLVNLVLLLLGTFMEVNAAKIMVLPILFPVSQQIGIDPVHFGVIVTANLCLGLLTPPVGIVLALACKIGNVPLERGAVASFPFLLAGIGVVLLITVWPDLSLWLPRLVLG